MPLTQTDQTDQTDQIDAIVHARTNPNGPGVAIAVVRAGQVIHSRGYGMAQIEWRQPIAPDTVFGIGSTSKPFTAMAILLLRAEGKLSLSDPITAYLPDYQTHGQIITIAHLLTHTSGIPNFVTLPGFWEGDTAHDHTHAELRARFEQLPLQFAPGARYSYNNSAYCLLGMVIETLAGMPYGEFIQQRIFTPLGMARSHYFAPHAVISQRAEGYAPVEGGPQGTYERALYMSTTLQYAAGALGSTVEDLARWDLALRDGRLLDHATQAAMTTPTRLTDGHTVGYGMGWGLSTYRGKRVIHHAGGVPGYTAFYGRFPDDDLSIIVLSNWNLFDSGGLAAPIANLLLDLPTPQHSPTALEPGALARMTGAYTKVLGEALNITPGDGVLHTSGELNCDLIPRSATTCVSASHPDTQVHFANEGSDGFERATVVTPFSWYEVTRTRSS
ncbi:MAG TPA: serine hydrolase domain-containing protein [Ktedonobacterales bacterium]